MQGIGRVLIRIWKEFGKDSDRIWPGLDKDLARTLQEMVKDLQGLAKNLHNAKQLWPCWKTYCTSVSIFLKKRDEGEKFTTSNFSNQMRPHIL